MSFNRLLAAKRLEGFDTPSLDIPAVAHCASTWDKVYRAYLKQKQSDYCSENAAGRAYREAMPPLYGYDNICDFIACANYGMLLGAIEPDHVTKLLYAAQVALAADKCRARYTAKTPSKPTPSPSLTAILTTQND